MRIPFPAALALAQEAVAREVPPQPLHVGVQRAVYVTTSESDARAAAEEARWRKLVAPVAEQWARETPNGARVLEAFRAEIAAFEAKNKGK